ncbi:hypothetical protein KEM54_002312 [Ascosphaera aggregata]|nr:hypothetical protein KEM54_002312 [Ascosphaera aggregata]
MSQSLLLSLSSTSLSSSSSRTVLASLISVLDFTRHASTTTRRHIDPWAVAAARQRRAANISRQQELRAQREAALGHPLRGKITPFMETLVPGRVASLSAEANAKRKNEAKDDFGWEGKMELYKAKLGKINPDRNASEDVIRSKLNYFLSQEEVELSLDRSTELARPLDSDEEKSADPQEVANAKKAHIREDTVARDAIRRIIQLQNGNNKDSTRVNVIRCIEEFGRHNTDAFLAKRLPSYNEQGKETENELPKKRVGPDTGSPEVQAAILTTKIEVLSRQLEHTSHKDKHNKRNLRLLVHRRQKMLKYLRRKERGGPRWQNLMEKLGLTDASWKGEISM